MIDSFKTVDEMLDADNLGHLIGRRVLEVTGSEMQTEGFSENAMQRITGSLENGAQVRLVLKQFDSDDWLMKLSADTHVREISFLETGLYADLPAPCSAPAIAATRDANGAALLMWDISEFLFAQGDSSISEDALEACVRALATLHSHYWDDQYVSDGQADLCSIDDWINLLSPNVGRNRVRLGVDNDVTSVLEDGWAAFAGVASPLAARTVSAIHANPGTLLHALESLPRTLVHGDVKLANLGVDPSTDGVMMLDWSFASFAPALVEVGWFLAVNSARLPVPKETVIHLYRTMLASRGVELDSDWQRSLDLGLLAGGTLRLGWAKAFGALSDDEAVRTRESAEIEWWSEATERASLWLR